MSDDMWHMIRCKCEPTGSQLPKKAKKKRYGQPTT